MIDALGVWPRVIIRRSRFAEPIDKEAATRGDVDEVHDHVQDPAGALHNGG